MTQTQRFCTQCGAELKPGSRFCGACGEAVEQPAAQAASEAPATPPEPTLRAAQPPAQPAQPAGEGLLAIVPNLRQRKGFMGVKSESYNMMILPARLVFAFISNDTMKAEVAEAHREAKAQGKNWAGIVGAQMSWQTRFCAKLAEMGADQVLARYPGSFSVANAEIRRVRLGAPADDESNVQGEMSIETGSQKLKLELITEQPQQVKRLLQPTLGAVVK